jgi:hypothetical protein
MRTITALALLALCGCESDAQWGARQCGYRDIPEGTPEFQTCVQHKIADLHDTWARLDEIRRERRH